MTFIIAEAGINHCGSLARAIDMIDVAHEAGADAVKFQAYDHTRFPNVSAKTYGLLKECELHRNWYAVLAKYAVHLDIEFMCTPFQPEFVEILDPFVKRWKVSSQSVTNDALLCPIAETRKPVIISNGMCTDVDMSGALATLGQGRGRHTILSCVSKYPTPETEIDLTELRRLRLEEFPGCDVGFSDHTSGIWASIAAAAVGADVIEFHFTLDRGLSGPDQVCSKEPNEMTHMIKQIRAVTA